MTEPTTTGWRRGAVALSLAAALGMALVIPIPSLPDGGREDVRATVAERLPGWTIDRLDPSWEGAYTVVTRCAGLQVDFQYVPGHGLPPRDAWLHPSDAYARARLDDLSDSRRYLIWREEPRRGEALSCPEQLARIGGSEPLERPVD